VKPWEKDPIVAPARQAARPWEADPVVKPAEVAPPAGGAVSLEPLAPAETPPKPEPASWWQTSPVGGVVRGARDIMDGGAQLLVRGVEAAIPDSWTGLDQWAKGEVARVEGINKGAEQDYQQNWREGREGFDGSRLLGNLLAGAPLAAAIPAGAGLGLGARTALSAAGGGVMSAFQPTDAADGDFWGAKAKQVGTGAAFGAAAAPVAAGIARIVSPKSSANVQTLMKEGVTPTPGQVLGGAWKSTEEKLSSFPLLGDAIKAGQRRAHRQLNEVALNRALEPLGQKLPSGMIGRGAIQHVDDALGQSYDDIINRVGAPAVDNQMLDELANLRSLLVGQPKNAAERLDDIIGSEILARTQHGRLTGEAIRAAEQNLGQHASGLLRDPISDNRKIGEATVEAQRILRSWLERSAPPELSEQLRATNKGWANFLRSRQAAASVGAGEGVFTPSQLQSAVKALDRSKGKSAFAKGTAVMQDISEPARAVLANEIPNSGTADRWLATLLAGGGAGAAATGAVASPTIAAAALPMAMYAPGVQRFVAQMLAGRQGQGFKATADGIRALTPAMGTLLAPQLAAE
jgi:hypothetical protein